MLELRHGPMHEALEAARPVLKAIGEALGPDGEVVLVPGNHDFRLIAPWLDWRSRNGPEPLGLQERAGPKASIGTRAIGRMLQPASLDVVYPGIWLRRRRLRHPRPLPRPPRDGPELRAPRRRRARARAGRARRRAAAPDDYEVGARADVRAARRHRRPRRRRASRRRRPRPRPAPGSDCRPTASATPGTAACSRAPSR